MTCDVPALTTELQISGCTAGGSVDYDTTCQYTCTLGYDLIGQYTVTCNEDGMFSSNAPRCQDFTDPCSELNPCVNGVCSSNRQGQYECECQEQYEGTNCDDPLLPLEVSIHPSNYTVEINSQVELGCGFNNFKNFHWYKNDVIMSNTDKLNTVIVPSVTPSDIGYYFCRGTGRDGQTLDTMWASLYVKDLTNIEILNVRFDIPFEVELYDQTSLLYRDTAKNISTYIRQGLETSVGLEGLSPDVVCNALRPGSIIADMNIYFQETNMTAFEAQDLISQSLAALANTSNGYLDSSTISVRNNAICPSISWISPLFGTVHFPAGENGTWANSTGYCPFNTTQANGPIGRALCVGDGILQSQWLPVDNCGPFRNVTDILTEIAQANLMDVNTDEVVEQVSIVTTNTDQITSVDLTLVADITSQVLQQNITSKEVTVSLTSVVSNIAQVDPELLEAAEREKGAISQFVQAFEEQITNVVVDDGQTLSIQETNIAVEVQSVPSDDITRGLVILVAGSSLSDLTKSNITIYDSTQGDIALTRSDFIAQVNIPPAISSAISSTSPLSGSQTNGSDFVRVNFFVYSTPVLFISRSSRNVSVVNEGFNRSANTPVISLSVGKGEIANLTEFINFTFTPITAGHVNPMCSFWNEIMEQDWSQDGCVLVSSSGIGSSDESCDSLQEFNNSAEERVVCSCNHLTNFAVLMDIHREEEPLEAYRILTYIGCGISVLSLLVTLATFLSSRELRTKQTNQIFICLCLTLLCLYTTFITMISLDSIRDHCEVPAIPCGILSALIHYFILSSIAWMGVEGYNTYLVIVKIFNTYIPNFMTKACLAAWGVPAVIVIITGAVARDHYAHDDFCFLQIWAQIGGLLIPMSIILLINIIIFIMVVGQLIRSANISGRVKRDTKEERRETIERIQNAICILLLMGLTWISGYLLLIPGFSQVAQPIFISLNSFQGLFIFLLYLVRKPLIRKRWRSSCLGDKLPKQRASNSSSGIQSSMVPSSSGGIITGLRGTGPSDKYLEAHEESAGDFGYRFNPTYENVAES